MFDEAIVVQSAVSAFNNAALAAPAFLWYAALAVPLFVLVYFCGGAFLSKLGWKRDNMISHSAVAVVVLTFMWFILFGGNYAVLRDGVSVLPFLVAGAVFLCAFFIASHTRGMQIPRLRDMSRRMRVSVYGVVFLLMVALGLSDMHAWWGPLLQIGAFCGGAVLGRRTKYKLPDISGTILIMMTCVVAILMQPEFFRFGQLGNLTVLHMLGLLVFGALVAGTVVVNNVKPSGRIHRSAYIKLKWMARFITALGVVMFFLTESVPVFLGTVAVFMVLFGLSQWHAKHVSDTLGMRLFALAMAAFGVITTMPVITALGILCWANLPKADFWGDAKFLL
ncbi:MAG: hypothetical protein K2M34_01545 [Alphaproteobacteria bacterium]|nr:hypothetical protein [Alphaproteobacteria bacterium]